jgi:hypothetical protein
MKWTKTYDIGCKLSALEIRELSNLKGWKLEKVKTVSITVF